MNATATDEREGLPSASGIERIALCPGSWNLEKKAIQEAKLPQLENDYAESGTRVHASFAEEDGADDALDMDEERAVEIAKVQEEQIIAEYFREANDITIEREKRYWLRNGIRPIASCRVDVLAYSWEELSLGRKISYGLILDLKSGWGNSVPESPRNWQLLTEAVITSLHYGFERVGVGLIQPRVKGVKDIVIAEYGPAELMTAKIELEKVLVGARDENAPRRASLRACEYCKAKFICPEAQSALSLTAKTELSVMTPEQAGRLVEAAQLAAKLSSDILRTAKLLLINNPQAIAGYRLKPGAAPSPITDTAKCYQNMSAMFTAAEFTALCKVGKKALKEAYQRKTGLKGKALDQSFDPIVADCVTEKQNSPSLERM